MKKTRKHILQQIITSIPLVTNMNTQSLEEYGERMEHMILFQLTTNIKNGKLTVDEAQKIAQAYLKLQPTSREDLLQGVINMGHTYPVLGAVIASFSKEYDEEFKNDVLSQMHEKIHTGDIDSAVELGKQEGPAHA